MQIGGVDTVISDGKSIREKITASIRIARSQWSSLRIENLDTGDLVDNSDSLREIALFENEGQRASWDQYEMTESNDDAMILIMAKETEITIVSSQGSQVAKLIASHFGAADA